MRLAYSIAGKIAWIHDFLDKDMYKGIYRAIIKERKNITGQEMAFAKYISVGISPEDAYKKAFGASNKRYSKIRSGILLKTERIVAAIDKQLDDVFEDLCIDLKYLIVILNEVHLHF